MTAAIGLIVCGTYLACGFLFALPFAFLGVGKIDAHASHGSWGFRLLIIPGAAALWPILLRRLIRGVHQPPEERTAHRLNAACTVKSAELTSPKELSNSGCGSSAILHSSF